MVDVGRDPRWGRVMEGAGEDPYLGTQIALARMVLSPEGVHHSPRLLQLSLRVRRREVVFQSQGHSMVVISGSRVHNRLGYLFITQVAFHQTFAFIVDAIPNKLLALSNTVRSQLGLLILVISWVPPFTKFEKDRVLRWHFAV